MEEEKEEEEEIKEEEEIEEEQEFYVTVEEEEGFRDLGLGFIKKKKKKLMFELFGSVKIRTGIGTNLLRFRFLRFGSGSVPRFEPEPYQV